MESSESGGTSINLSMVSLALIIDISVIWLAVGETSWTLTSTVSAAVTCLIAAPLLKMLGEVIEGISTAGFMLFGFLLVLLFRFAVSSEVTFGILVGFALWTTGSLAFSLEYWITDGSPESESEPA